MNSYWDKKQWQAKILLIFAGIVVCNFLSFSHSIFNPDKIYFQNLSISNGLSQMTVKTIIQDKCVFFWFGTDDGLNRFDSTYFRIFKNIPDQSDSLSNSTVNALIIDRHDQLWIATNNGLNRYNHLQENFSSFFLSDQLPFHSSSNVINAIAIDQDGNFWLATNFGVVKFNTNSNNFTRFTRKNEMDALTVSNQFSSICLHPDPQLLWLGLAEESQLPITVFNKSTLQFLEFEPEQIKNIGNQIRIIHKDKKNITWFGSRNHGLSFYNPDSQEFINFQHHPDNPHSLSHNLITAIISDHENNLWVATHGGGLNLFNKTGKNFIRITKNNQNPMGLDTNNLSSLYEDRTGNLWIGSWDKGLKRYHHTEIKFQHLYYHPDNPNSLTGNSVFSICEDQQENVWIGTIEGLNLFDRKSNRVKPVFLNDDLARQNQHLRILRIIQKKNHFLWIGTNNGLFLFNQITGQSKRFINELHHTNSLNDNRIFALFEDHSGLLWIGTWNSGLNLYDPAANRFSHFLHHPQDNQSISNNRVLAIIEDRQKNIWIGTAAGLNCYHRKTQTFTRHLHQPDNSFSISNDYVSVIYEDHQKQLWIGTANGLNRFEKEQNRFIRYDKKSGLINTYIYGILEDEDQNFWLSTNYGLCQFHPKKGLIQNFDKTDGLQENEFNVAHAKCKDGTMFFGGINGVSYFHPKDILINQEIPPVVLTDFQLFNQAVLIGKNQSNRTILPQSITYTNQLELYHFDYVFTLQFAALNYVSAEKNHYAYQLSPLDKNWNYTGTQTSVTYSGLTPGNYVFKVIAANNDNVWNQDGLQLKIKINPAYYQTWWFRTLLALLTIAAVLLFIRWRISINFKLNEELEMLVSKRTIQLTEVLDQKQKEINDRIYAEKALKESEEKYKTVVNNAIEGIVIIVNHKIRFFNTPFISMIGSSAAEIMNHDFRELIAADVQETTCNSLFPKDISTKKQERIETYLIGHPENMAVEISRAQIQFENQQADLLFIQDIRFKKELEKERMKSVKFELSGSMVRGITHDFNNLLSVILGNINMALMHTIPGDRIIKPLLEAEKASLKAAGLTQQFIALSEGGEPVKRIEKIEEIVKKGSLFASEIENFLITYSFSPDLFSVDCDRVLIEQVVYNLTINAVQAMPGGGQIEITGNNTNLSAENPLALSAGPYVTISIIDEGCGIAQEHLSVIFDPYFSTKEHVNQKGQGLGLSISLSIIKRHKGEITVKSELGRGSTFTIYLPATIATQNETPLR